MRSALNRAILLTALLCLALAACTRLPPKPRVQLPPLQLAPSAFGGTLALQQRLRFSFGPQQREMDALLEVDTSQVRLAVQAMARTGVTLVWDGTTLQQTRADWLPDAVRGERVLDDLQFVHWPEAAIRAALPATWTLRVDTVDGVPVRRLQRDGETWLEARYPAPDRIELDNRAEGYRLEVLSFVLQPAPADEAGRAGSDAR